MARHVVIVGGGAVGTYLASLLLAGGHQVTVVEVQREEIPRLQRELSTDVVMVGNGTDPRALRINKIPPYVGSITTSHFGKVSERFQNCCSSSKTS